MKKILGIETTCDETSASVVCKDRIVLSCVTSSQIKTHQKYGGVVPELSARMHLEKLPLVVEQALKEANTSIKDINIIAIAKNPGLPPSLSVGYAFASGLAISNNIPLVEIDHLEAHISGIWLSKIKRNAQDPVYPIICLIVSGGHTEIRLINKDKTQKIIGRTIDDAVGESYDKVAKMLGLTYPGGPIIDELARLGDGQAFRFPRPMKDSFDFSFSGLKTAVLRVIEKRLKYDNLDSAIQCELDKNWTNDICASFQEAVIETLVTKTIKVANELGVNNIAVAGGVSANRGLREEMAKACEENGFSLFYPEIEYCGDNAANIGARACEI